MSAVKVAPFEGTPAEWDAFARAHPAATHCHLWGWRRVVEAAYGHDCPYLAARGADGALAGILPLVDVRTLALGRFLVSMPFLNYGGPLGTAGAECALVESAASMARERRAKLLELRCAGEVGGGLPASHDKITVVLDIAGGGADAVWKGFSSKLRSQVRKPEKEGVTMAFGADQVEPFFRVFARHMRDLGTPTHPLSFFAAVAAEMGEAAWFGCAYRGGQPVAGGCAVRMGDSVELVWASALR
ncbi:MAG: GNAT family N-acetyltransferase, partial [Gemmatimonadetes bacterium]|nr:GNAT family N-acetyltransferase [Gemmatimonadota bacterium]